MCGSGRFLFAGLIPECATVERSSESNHHEVAMVFTQPPGPGEAKDLGRQCFTVRADGG